VKIYTIIRAVPSIFDYGVEVRSVMSFSTRKEASAYFEDNNLNSYLYQVLESELSTPIVMTGTPVVTPVPHA